MSRWAQLPVTWMNRAIFVSYGSSSAWPPSSHSLSRCCRLGTISVSVWAANFATQAGLFCTMLRRSRPWAVAQFPQWKLLFRDSASSCWNCAAHAMICLGSSTACDWGSIISCLIAWPSSNSTARRSWSQSATVTLLGPTMLSAAYPTNFFSCLRWAVAFAFTVQTGTSCWRKVHPWWSRERHFAERSRPRRSRSLWSTYAGRPAPRGNRVCRTHI